MSVKLYGYWCFSVVYCLCIVLNFKGIEYEQVLINFKDGEQIGDVWLNIQFQGLVLVLEVDGQKLV